MQNKMSLIKLSLLIILTIEYIKSQATRYKVYDNNNNYPRPLLLDKDNDDVMAFSGKPRKNVSL